jgi:hypothetical protein
VARGQFAGVMERQVVWHCELSQSQQGRKPGENSKLIVMVRTGRVNGDYSRSCARSARLISYFGFVGDPRSLLLLVRVLDTKGEDLAGCVFGKCGLSRLQMPDR